MEEELYREIKRRKGDFTKLFFAIVTILTSIIIMVLFKDDFLYYFSNKKPVNLGEVGIKLNKELMKENSFVEITGVPWTTRAISYEKRFSLFGGKGRYSIFPLVGAPNIFIRYFREEGGREDILPGYFAGRLVKFGKIRGFSTIRQFYLANLGVLITKDSWIIFDGDTPQSYLGYVILYIILSIFVLINLFFIVKKVLF